MNTETKRLRPIIALGQLTMELIDTQKAILMVGKSEDRIQAICKGVTAYGATSKEALANLEIALIDAEQEAK